MNVTSRWLFWFCLPWVAPQAIWLRKHAPRLPEAGGPYHGQKGTGPPLNLFGIGDSIIAGVGVALAEEALTGCLAGALGERLPATVRWRSLGHNGYTAGRICRELLPQIPQAPPQDVFLLSTGVNDVTHLRHSATWRRNLAGLLDGLRAHSPRALIVMAGVPPLHAFPLLPQPLRSVIGLRARTFDRMAEALIRGRKNTLYVPLRFDPRPDKFSPDGYHPAAATYREIGDLIAGTLLAGNLLPHCGGAARR